MSVLILLFLTGNGVRETDTAVQITGRAQQHALQMHMTNLGNVYTAILVWAAQAMTPAIASARQIAHKTTREISGDVSAIVCRQKTAERKYKQKINKLGD